MQIPLVQEPTPVADTGLGGLVLIAAFLGVPADPDQMRHQLALGSRLSVAGDLVRAARRLQLKARIVRTSWRRLRLAPMPALVEQNDGGFCVIGHAEDDGEHILIQYVGEALVRRIPQLEFEAVWSGRLVLFTRRASIPSESRRFGFGWFLPAIVRYRRILSEVLISSFALQLIALGTPLVFQIVIDKVLVHRGTSTLNVLVIALVMLAFSEVTLTALRNYLFSHTTNRIDVDLGARLYKHLLELPIAYFQARRVGDSVARVRELENLRNFLTSSALTVVLDLFFIVMFLAVMFFYSSTLTWIVIGALPIYFLLSALATPIFHSRLNEKFKRGAENQAFLVESITGIETLKALAVEPQMQREWEERLAAYVGAAFSTTALGNWAQQAIQLIGKLVTAATLFFGAKAVIAGDMTVGELVAFNMLSARVAAPVLRMASLWQDFHEASISVERLGDIFNSPREGSAESVQASLPPIRGDVRFEGVTFRYRPDGPAVLSDINLDVPAGQVIGIVGSSGSGKSTLTKLMQRLYVPEQGRVLVDGIDLSLVDSAWLRLQVGVVLQENMLFNRSVRQNIALADPALSLDRVIEAAELAGAQEFITRLPFGYDTIIGERGTSLSGGQRQRLAIARALCTRPRILIFDEATSALDYESERIVQDNMRGIAVGRTVFIIAHRLSTVRTADRIITIERGKLIEDGPHHELIRGNGRYATLHRLQAGAEVNA